MKLEGARGLDAHRHLQVLYFLLVGLGILLGINAAGVDITALNVLTGAIGLGLGFGLQAIASNFVSGFVLLHGQVDQARRCHQLHRAHRHQHREFRLGAGAARPLRRGARPRRRRDAGAEPEPHHQLGHQLELLGPARAPPPAGDDQLSRTIRRSRCRCCSMRPPNHPRILREPGPGVAPHELRGLRHAPRSALLDRAIR